MLPGELPILNRTFVRRADCILLKRSFERHIVFRYTPHIAFSRAESRGAMRLLCSGIGDCTRMSRWIGIDQGYSHLAVAVVDEHGSALRSESTEEPEGNGHDRKTALARLGLLLDRLEDFRAVPVRLAGYCYQDSGIR